jgi:hypothetical protein
MPGPDIFTGMTVAQKQAALTQAQQAYVQLASGAKVATASYAQGDGAKSVTYTQAELGPLTMIIKQLQVSLGMLRRARRPMRFIL